MLRFHTDLTHCEIRRVSEGQTKDHKPTYTIRVEDSEGDPVEISCRDTDLFASVARLRKGDIADLPILVVANAQYQFCALAGAPVVWEDEQ